MMTDHDHYDDDDDDEPLNLGVAYGRLFFGQPKESHVVHKH